MQSQMHDNFICCTDRLKKEERAQKENEEGQEGTEMGCQSEDGNQVLGLNIP